MNAAKRALIKLAVIGTLATGAIVMPMTASADPSNPPQNPNACVGHSSTTANAVYQDADPAKYRDEQAHGESNPAGTTEQGRQDDIQYIFAGAQCVAP